MTIQEKKRELARYRLRQAQESIQEAHILLSTNMSLRSVVNRVYYGMFYAILALLIFEPYSSSKHSGVIAYFHKRFIKEGVFSAEFGELLRDAFELRQGGDYHEFYELVSEKVEPLLEKAPIFLEKIRLYLGNTEGV